MKKSLSDLGVVIKDLVPEFRKQALPAIIGLGSLLSFYLLSVFVPEGIVTQAISFVALAVLVITALARVNDISINLTGYRWSLRRLSLVMVACGSFGFILSGHIPSWFEAMIFLGMAGTWFTTPGMPPWWRWIAGKDAHHHIRDQAHG